MKNRTEKENLKKTNAWAQIAIWIFFSAKF